MADINEQPACVECTTFDGGWVVWCDECHVLAREELARLRAENAALRMDLAEVETELSEERDHAAEGWERARHLQGLLQAAELGESKQIRRAEAAEAKLAAVRARIAGAGVLTVDFSWRDELLALIDKETDR